MRRNSVVRRVVCSLVLTLLFASAAVAADAPAPLSAEERQALTARLQELGDRLAPLRPKDVKDAAAFDHWADADAYRKGVEWALRYDQAFTPADKVLLDKSLTAGGSRAAELKAGTSSWSEVRGKKLARAYVSDIDGSTQPFGLVIPAGYDGQK